MREDGFRVDQIVLTTDANYDPGRAAPYEQASDGLVEMEAEDYHENIAGSVHDWVFIDDLPDYSGDGAMRATPDLGTAPAERPQLDFDVNFVKTGIHYIWVRGYVTGGSDDSCNIGLDGSMQSDSDKISGFNTANDWAWTSVTMDGVRATLEVDSVGVHTVNLWMREDGFRVDQIVLTTDADYDPDGT